LQLLQNSCRKTGKTVIVITHNQAISHMADRIIHIKNGKIVSLERNLQPVPVEQIEW
jgi:putative ABC transport system ATP-binding protein